MTKRIKKKPKRKKHYDQENKEENLREKNIMKLVKNIFFRIELMTAAET